MSKEPAAVEPAAQVAPVKPRGQKEETKAIR
jgi:hypothetical protein